MEKWLKEEVGRTRYSTGIANMGAAGSTEVGREMRENHDEVKKTGEDSREEWRMEGKMSMVIKYSIGSRTEVAKPGRETEIPWISSRKRASAWMSRR